MKKISLLAALFISVYSFAQTSQSDGMNNEKLGQILKRNSNIVRSQSGFWSVEFRSTPLLIITDEYHNRMRIVTGIAEQKKVKKKEMVILLESNFDKALDAKYAFANGFLMAVFTHPLKELTKDQFVDAMDQVVRLSKTYGTTYQSSDLTFSGGSSDEKKKKKNR